MNDDHGSKRIHLAEGRLKFQTLFAKKQTAKVESMKATIATLTRELDETRTARDGALAKCEVHRLSGKALVRERDELKRENERLHGTEEGWQRYTGLLDLWHGIEHELSIKARKLCEGEGYDVATRTLKDMKGKREYWERANIHMPTDPPTTSKTETVHPSTNPTVDPTPTVRHTVQPGETWNGWTNTGAFPVELSGPDQTPPVSPTVKRGNLGNQPESPNGCDGVDWERIESIVDDYAYDPRYREMARAVLALRRERDA